jgi:hypothetical protein
MLNKSKLLVIGLLAMLTLTACGGGTVPTPTEADVPPIPTFSLVPPTPIAHTMIPGEPVYLLAQLISDCTIGNGVTVGKEAADSSQVILSKGCDQWTYNKLERPFEDTFTNYAPQSDISKAQIGYDDDWFFAQLFTYFGEFADPQPMNGTYGIELDRDLDGRGEILILAHQPGKEWNVAGVQVWRDNDTSVGAETPVIADEDNPNGGYDELVFDAGLGDDPDLAWARISPTDPHVVQIAFKRTLGTATDKEQFSWLMWAGLADFNPKDFDLVDTFNKTDVYDLDNTCAWTYNVPLQGFPNQCGIVVRDKPDSSGGRECVQPPMPDQNSCPGQWIWDADACEWSCDPLI